MVHQGDTEIIAKKPFLIRGADTGAEDQKNQAKANFFHKPIINIKWFQVHFLGKIGKFKPTGIIGCDVVACKIVLYRSSVNFPVFLRKGFCCHPYLGQDFKTEFGFDAVRLEGDSRQNKNAVIVSKRLESPNGQIGGSLVFLSSESIRAVEF